MKWDVVDVKAIVPLAIRVQFADGTIGKVQFQQSHLKGVFKALKGPTFSSKHILKAELLRGPVMLIWHQTRCTKRLNLR